MSIEYQVQGAPGRDNALFVRINSGQAVYRLQFDCGSGCLAAIPYSEMRAIDHLLFSHLHMDHVAGFDTFFRSTFNRESKPVTVWGPPETARIMHNRFRGYIWNFVHNSPGTWYVNDIYPDRVERRRYEASEAFSYTHSEGAQPFDGTIIENEDFSIRAIQLNHMTASMAYLVREYPRYNVDTAKLATLQISPGPWLQYVKFGKAAGAEEIEVDGKRFTLAELRQQLLIESPGDSIAYLTDFLLDTDAFARLVPFLQGCDTVICESQYRAGDLELAEQAHHLTATQAAELARQVEAGKLILFHVSDRYQEDELRSMLHEARAIFSRTSFPAHWHIH